MVQPSLGRNSSANREGSAHLARLSDAIQRVQMPVQTELMQAPESQTASSKLLGAMYRARVNELQRQGVIDTPVDGSAAPTEGGPTLGRASNPLPAQGPPPLARASNPSLARGSMPTVLDDEGAAVEEQQAVQRPLTRKDSYKKQNDLTHAY